jgi:hypothetical protein
VASRNTRWQFGSHWHWLALDNARYPAADSLGPTYEAWYLAADPTYTYPIAGTCAVTTATSGTVTAKRPVVGNPAAASTATSAAISRKVWLSIAGRVDAASGTSAAVTRKSWASIAGTVAASSGTSAAVSRKVWASVAGTVAATSGTSCAVSVKAKVAGNPVAAVSGTSCNVTVYSRTPVVYPIAGRCDVASGTSAAVTAKRPVGFTRVNVTSGTSGRLASRILKVVGTPVAVSTSATARVFVRLPISGRVACSSGTSGAVSRKAWESVAGITAVVSGTSAAPYAVKLVDFDPVDVVTGGSVRFLYRAPDIEFAADLVLPGWRASTTADGWYGELHSRAWSASARAGGWGAVTERSEWKSTVKR